MKKTVNQMYQKTKTLQSRLLSDFNASFWSDYKANYTHYDKLFSRLYYSWTYFLQNENETIEEVTSNFIEEVYNHLLLNEKRYSELYRIHVVDDDNYSLTDNYNMIEQMTKDGTSNNDNTYGARSDSTSDSVGSQSTSSTDKVAPYNSEGFYNDRSTDVNTGARTDSSSFNKGQEVDNLNNTFTENYTLTRVGNIGVMTATDMIDKHNKFWTVFEFYQLIFREIAKELLMVGC